MEDIEYLKILRGAIEAGIVKVSLDLAKLEHIDSPISVQADSNRWIYGLIITVAAAAWFGGLWWAVGAAAAGGAAWFAVGRPWHRRRMEQRFYQSALQNMDVWKKLWRMPGIVLIDPKAGTECASPSGNWRAFVGAATSGGGASAQPG
jgi:hypothetical protein